MSQNDFKFGFLTILKIEGFGACGGLLVLTPEGRPVEFHCTAPVSPNRTQEILFGKSLESYLYCDQIGQTLLAKSKTPIEIVVTDQAALRELKVADNQSVVIVNHESTEGSVLALGEKVTLESGNEVSIFAAQSEQLELTKARIKEFSLRLPIGEPFERIESAIDEAQSVAK